MAVKAGNEGEGEMEKGTEDVVLDTSFILTALKFRIDLFTELPEAIDRPHRIIILDSVANELEKLGARINGKEAKLALELLKLHDKKYEIVRSKKGNAGNADLSILDYASTHAGCTVCTQDRGLREKLKNFGARIMVIKGKKAIKYA